MTIHVIKEELDKGNTVSFPAKYVTTVMQEAERHIEGSLDWRFKIYGGICEVTNPSVKDRIFKETEKTRRKHFDRYD